MKLKIKKGATVQVISGSDKGKRGTVLEIAKNSLKIRVQGVRIQTNFDKKDGLVKKEGLIDYSNVKLIEQAPAKAKGSKAAKTPKAKKRAAK